MPHHFVSQTCQGEHCTRCFRLQGTKVAATHKMEESIAFDDPLQERHPLTNYACCECFAEFFGACLARSLKKCLTCGRTEKEVKFTPHTHTLCAVCINKQY